MLHMMSKYYLIYKIKSFFILFFIINIIYLLNYLTPLNWDDFSYKFIFELNNEANPLRLVSNVPDILYSQYNHYFSTNGRSICHFFVQLFSGIIGKEIFNFVNTLVYIGFIILLNIYNNKFNTLYLFFSFSLVFLLFPAFNETVLWMTGSINYLWTCTGTLVFLCLFKYFSYNTKKYNCYWIILFIVSFILGWSHEGISLPLAGALIMYFLWKKSQINFFQLFLILGFIAGSFICSFSPSTINRSAVNQSSLTYLLIHKGESFFIVLCKLRALYVLILLFIIKYVGYFRRNKNDLILFWRNNFILIFCVLFSFIIIFLAGQTDTRSAVGLEFFSLLLILRLFSYGNRKFNNFGKKLFCFLAIILLPFIFYYSYENCKNFNNVEYQLKETDYEIILYKDMYIPGFIRQYIMVPRSYNFISRELGNGALNLFYEKSNIIFVPYNIYKNIKDSKKKIYNIALQTDYKFYVLPIEENYKDKVPYFILNQVNDKDIPLIFRAFKNKLDRYRALEIMAQDYQFVNIDGNDYMLIGRNEMVDNRVNSIVLK